MRYPKTLCLCLFTLFYSGLLFGDGTKTEKPEPSKGLQILKDGNERFVQGKAVHPHSGIDRRALANKESQAKYALATIVSCSDSRVPPELIFDAGIMDLFVIRIAGNICNTAEAGSIEYGLFNVNTPVLIIMGHSKCGAVMAAAQMTKEDKHKRASNIPPLLEQIMPAVKRVIADNPDMKGSNLIDLCTEENVWQAFSDLFTKSPETRELVKSGKVKALGAIYDLETGKVNWLPEEKVLQILDKVSKEAK